MPYLGLSSFLRVPKILVRRVPGITSRQGCVSMPYLGLSSFLPKMAEKEAIEAQMFQCSTSGFLLFYATMKYTARAEILSFQCPTSGFLLFYQNKELASIEAQIGFNALPRAFFFSTAYTDNKGEEHGKGFNALPRAFFFSTVYGVLEFINNKKVSMPYLGLSSFLRYVSASLEFTDFANPFLRVII